MMFRCLKLISAGLFFLVCSFSLVSQQDDQEPIGDIRDKLSSEEFKRAGLEKLSSDELLFLNGSLYGWKQVEEQSEPSVGANVPAKVSFNQERAFGNEKIESKEREKEDRVDSIQTSITGKFRGWSGRTTFNLNNGQTWRQIDKRSFKVNLDSPAVTVEKGFFGAYYLSVEGYNSRCKVERVK